MKVKTEIVNLFDKTNPFKLEVGSELPYVQAAYQTYGELNPDGTNAILICHALTGNAHAAGILSDEEHDIKSNPDLLNKYSVINKDKPGWWDELIGEGKLFDTNKYFVISSNILGSCYGTTGPVSIKNIFNRNYGMNFPTVTVRDMVRLEKALVDHLNVNKLATVVGGSLGGMQVLEWAVMYPEMVSSIIPIATSAQHSPWAISLNEASRRAIKNDPKWMNGNYKTQPYDGLALARKIAMISYRSMESFEQKFSRERKDENSSKLDIDNIFQIESYLNHHGDKIYTVLFQEVLLKSISENRMGYQMFDISEKVFTITFRYNWIKIVYELPENNIPREITDIPIDFKPAPLDRTKNGGTY